MRKRARKALAALGLGFGLAWGTFAPEASGQPASRGEKIYHKSRAFRIPLSIEPEARPRIREVYLAISTDGGGSWQKVGKATPDQAWFSYKTARDGEYWIAVQTLDTKGRLYPPEDAAIEPSMKVVVDTTPPAVVLAENGRRGSRASVRWDISDAHLLPKTLVVEYQAEGARDWRQVPIHNLALIGSEEWDAGTAGPLKVRARVDDRAGNRGTAEVVLPDGIAANPGPATANNGDFEPPPPISPISSASMPSRRPRAVDEPFDADDSRGSVANDASEAPAPVAPARVAHGQTLLVSSPRFPLQYAVDDSGPTGPALVELWTTRDGGRSWNRQPEDVDRTSPYNVDLGGDGTFGLWLVVQSAAGLGDPPPAPGDRPQTWVEVDSTAPTVQLDRPKVGTGNSFGKVLITWRATDAHLANRPIQISYRADRPDATWQPITDRIENTGRYIWTLPASTPPRFHVRVDAYDAVGNRGSAETTDVGAVLVDRTRPKGRIIGLDPSALGGTDGRSRR
jgi:hypothetical protein